MVGGQVRQRMLTALTIGTLLALALAPGALAGKKGGSGGGVTTPGNFRVIGTTAYSVTFAWDASQSSAGIASYTICCANVNSITVPGTQTTAVFDKGVFPGSTHSYRMFARDNAGRASGYTESITVTTPRDTSSPAKPSLAVTEIGPRHVSLSWSAADDDPNPLFTVFVNGSPFLQNVKEKSGTITPLAYETTYEFTVRARDHGGNVSVLSDPVSARTLPKDTSDVTPPTAPPGLFVMWNQSDGETGLVWSDSFDAVTPPSRIIYCMYINGVGDGCQVGYTRSVHYGPAGQFNTYSIEAIDESGNVSARSEILVDNR
jgi:chitodextrinase